MAEKSSLLLYHAETPHHYSCMIDNISLPQEGFVFDGTFHQHIVEYTASVAASEGTLALSICPLSMKS